MEKLEAGSPRWCVVGVQSTSTVVGNLSLKLKLNRLPGPEKDTKAVSSLHPGHSTPTPVAVPAQGKAILRHARRPQQNTLIQIFGPEVQIPISQPLKPPIQVPGQVHLQVIPGSASVL
jgi:hypothetical protein